MSQWVNICKIDDILPATGVCALLGQQQVAIFRPTMTTGLRHQQYRPVLQCQRAVARHHCRA
jgi:hypothetical protein